MLPKEGKELHAASRQSNDLADLARSNAEAFLGELGDTHHQDRDEVDGGKRENRKTLGFGDAPNQVGYI
jgi:hypothetical protein